MSIDDLNDSQKIIVIKALVEYGKDFFDDWQNNGSLEGQMMAEDIRAIIGIFDPTGKTIDDVLDAQQLDAEKNLEQIGPRLKESLLKLGMGDVVERLHIDETLEKIRKKREETT